MRWLVMAILIVLAASFQAVVPAIRIAGEAKVPFLLGVILYYAFARDTLHMTIAGFVAGFLHDTLTYIPLGYSSLLFLVLGFIASRFKRFIRRESLLPPLIFGALSGLVSTIVMYLLLRRHNLVEVTLTGALLKSIGSGILGGLVVPLVYWISRLLDSAVDTTEVEINAD